MEELEEQMESKLKLSFFSFFFTLKVFLSDSPETGIKPFETQKSLRIEPITGYTGFYGVIRHIDKLELVYDWNMPLLTPIREYVKTVIFLHIYPVYGV